ncbi:MAG: glycerophosphodiester phosphodiesterase [Clostridiales bacterium]|nr:glycerophosphodiester phosphodiesterase [Clostridiales bacterium]
MILFWILAIVLLLAGLYLLMITPSDQHPDTSMLEGWLYAHRGLHDGNKEIPENSLEAFRRAVENGYGMELDVQLTADGKLVVFHDKTLKRVCGVDHTLYSLTYEELKQFPLPDGSPIPLFSEVLTLVNGRVPMIVEVKYHGQVTAIAKAAHEALKHYDGPYCVESFHPLAVRYFRMNAPDIVRGQLAYGGKWKKEDNSLILHFCMKHLLVNVLSRPHFVAYSVPTDHTLSMWLMKHFFKPLLAAWTIRDQHTLDSASEYDFPIFELFTPDDSQSR